MEETNNYFKALDIANLSDEQIVLAEDAKWSLLFLKVFGAFCSLPLFAFGLLFNALPFIIRRKVKNSTFLSTFNFVVGLFAFPLFYLMASYMLFAWTGSMQIAFITLITMPFAGKIAYQLFIFYHGIFHEFIFLSNCKSKLKATKQLIAQRNIQIQSILEEVNN